MDRLALIALLCMVPFACSAPPSSGVGAPMATPAQQTATRPIGGWAEVSIADAHVHLLDFLQNGEYFEDGRFVPRRPGDALAAGERGKRIEAVLRAMDAANVSHALVGGMPFVKKWAQGEGFRSAYYLDSSSRVVRARDTDYHVALAVDDFRRAGGGDAQKQLERLFVSICGFDSTDLGAVDMIAKRMKEYPGMFRVIGEVMSRHDDLTNLTTGERPRANHAALFRVYDFAGEFGIPVSIHHNIAPVSPGDEIKEPLYLPELLDAFNEFPKTTFIWCHAGISRRINVSNLTGVLDEVLATHHEHVFIDISWVVYPDYVLKNLDAWATLIRKYPGNFVLGSDAVGRFHDYEQQIRIFDELFDALADEDLVLGLAKANFLRIMPAQGISLPEDYYYPENRYVMRPPASR